MIDNNTNGVELKSAADRSADADVPRPDIDHVDDPASVRGDTTGDETGATGADEDGADSADERVKEDPIDAGRTHRRVSISVSARRLVSGALIAVVVGMAATLGWLYIDARRELDAQARKVDNYAHAEKIALDYAVNAATMNYQDLGGWKAKLVAGTTPELNDKLTKAAESMQQILIPLQWTSSAQPLVAKVRSSTEGIYVVDCFVSVQTKTVQAPDPLQSTATYSLTLDSNKNWQITDVGGVGAVTGQK